MTYKEMTRSVKKAKQRKFKINKQWILPALVFIAGLMILLLVVDGIRDAKREQEEAITQLNAVSYGDRIISDLTEGVSVTEALEQIIIDEDGKIGHFYGVAANLINDSIQCIQLAPGGVVTQIYPEEGNEAGKIDLIHDQERGEISRYSRDCDITIMQGPIKLNQGGVGISVRNPVYLENEQGEKEFWGFTIAIMRVPEIFDNSLNALSNFGYEYQILKTESPLSSEYKVVYGSGKRLDSPVSYGFEAGGCVWKLQVMPSAGWGQKGKTAIIAVIIFGLVVISLLTGLTASILVLQRRRNIFRDLSITDALTGLLNRNGFDIQTELYMKNHPDDPCIGVILDIDDFKFINDVHGHECGDETLRNLADSLSEQFGDNAIIARYGGDEFSMLLKNCTTEEAAAKIESFAAKPGFLQYGGKAHQYTISLGYAKYPQDAKMPKELIAAADMALYGVKMKSKHGCMAYDRTLEIKTREPLGFALHDVSKNLPGAFLIYSADRNDDRILFATQELIQLAGCKDRDDFMKFTKGHFRNLIHPDEQDKVEESIWRQISTQQDGTNDYVRFRFAKKDGSFRPILDHGRIVDSAYYGKVFYVLIMDCELIQSYYDGEI